MSEKVSESENSIQNIKVKETSINGKRKLLKKTFLKWSETVDLNCYNKVFEYKNNIACQYSWLIVLLVSSIATFGLITFNVVNFLNYEVVSQTVIINENPTEFPTITICDNNPFTTKYGEELIANVTNDNLNITNIFINKLYLSQLRASNPSYGDESRKLLGFKSNLIGPTFFNGVKIIYDFRWYWSFSYGNCFQFNSGFNNSNQNIDLIRVSREGINNGLLVGIFPLTNQNSYFSSFSTGMVLFVHNNSFKPSKEIFLEPGKMTYVSVKRIFAQKCPTPYSECIDLSTYSSELHDYIIRSNKKYRQQDCFELCIQQKIIKNCECFYTAYDRLNTQLRPCLNYTDYNCLTKKISEFDVNDCIKNSCPLECDSISYDLSLSSLVSPSEAFYRTLLVNTPKTLFDSYNLSVTYETYLSKSVYFYVYYPSLQYTLINETPKMSIFDLLTQIGGSLGMFVSFSIFSLFEMIEIFALLVYCLIKKQ